MKCTNISILHDFYCINDYTCETINNIVTQKYHNSNNGLRSTDLLKIAFLHLLSFSNKTLSILKQSYQKKYQKKK